MGAEGCLVSGEGRGLRVLCLTRRLVTTPCKVTPVILHGVDGAHQNSSAPTPPQPPHAVNV